jgi:hypothetical protein
LNEESMNKITINGVTITGDSVMLVGGRVIVDGVEQPGEPLSGRVTMVVVEGRLGNLQTDASVTCGPVEGDVSAGGSVNSGDIGGNVSAGGSIRCGGIGGNVNAGGSIRHG